MYSEMLIWCYNIKNYCMKHSEKWGVHSFQNYGQAFTSSYAGGCNDNKSTKKERKQFTHSVSKLINYEENAIIFLETVAGLFSI